MPQNNSFHHCTKTECNLLVNGKCKVYEPRNKLYCPYYNILRQLSEMEELDERPRDKCFEFMNYNKLTDKEIKQRIFDLKEKLSYLKQVWPVTISLEPEGR